MQRPVFAFVLAAVFAALLFAQTPSDPFSQAMAQGNLYFSHRKYELALDAYHKADKLAHHDSAACYLRIVAVERKLGDFSAALDAAKHAEKVAGDDKKTAIQAHLIRATLHAQMSGKPTDKKLKEAEQEIRDALALDPTQPLSQFDLGKVLLKQERDAEGVAELKKFLEMPGADDRSIAEARDMIVAPIRAREPFAPDFSFTTRENQKLSNAALRGKVVLFDFWGTWCPPCRESIPTIRDINKHYADRGLQIVGVSSDSDEAVWRTFIEAQHMDWSEYIDLSGSVLKAFEIDSFPTYVLLDKDGVIRFRQSGFGDMTRGELEEAINKTLKRAPDPKLAAPTATPPAGATLAPAAGTEATPSPARN
ncbi:MAG: redoxin family protein [Candidatus Acidiferrales bacterium]